MIAAPTSLNGRMQTRLARSCGFCARDSLICFHLERRLTRSFRLFVLKARPFPEARTGKTCRCGSGLNQWRSRRSCEANRSSVCRAGGMPSNAEIITVPRFQAGAGGLDFSARRMWPLMEEPSLRLADFAEARRNIQGFTERIVASAERLLNIVECLGLERVPLALRASSCRTASSTKAVYGSMQSKRSSRRFAKRSRARSWFMASLVLTEKALEGGALSCLHRQATPSAFVYTILFFALYLE